MSMKASIISQLADVAEGIETVSLGDETIQVQYMITKNNYILVRATDIVGPMLGKGIKDKKNAISKKIKACKFSIGNNLQEAILKNEEKKYDGFKIKIKKAVVIALNLTTMHKLVQEINGGDCEKNRTETLMMLITLTSNVSKIPYVCKASDQHPIETEEGESAMPVPEEEVVKYKRQRYGEWGKDQQGQMMPLSANAVIVFRDTVEAMKVAAQLSLEAKKAEDKRLEDFSRAVLKAKQDEDKRLEEFGRSVRKGKCDDMDTEIMLAIRASELVGLKATAQALATTAKKNEIAAANDILELQIIQLNKSSELEKLKKTESENKTAREKAEVEAEMAHSALLHEQKVAQAKELLLPTVATPLAPATAKAAEAENPDLSTTVLKEYIKIQSQFNFKNDAEKKAVLSSAGMITANKYRAKWGFSPEQRLEGEYGAVNFYPAAEGGMIIDSLRDAIRKVRGKGLQPALCFVRLAVSDL